MKNEKVLFAFDCYTIFEIWNDSILATKSPNFSFFLDKIDQYLIHIISKGNYGKIFLEKMSLYDIGIQSIETFSANPSLIVYTITNLISGSTELWSRDWVSRIASVSPDLLLAITFRLCRSVPILIDTQMVKC